MRKLRLTMVAAALITCAVLVMPVKANAQAIVTSNAVYTYDVLLADITELCATYPGIVNFTSIGTTKSGFMIPMITVGNVNAPHSIMIQASIHGREYATANMSMKIAEYYASLFAQGQLQDLFANTCFYVVPMANPEGVSISQSTDKNWKSNGQGVDLNRNFNANWAIVDTKGVFGPAASNYKGPAAESEAESKALVKMAVSKNFDCYISYHQAGNIIYYDDAGTTDAVSAASTCLAQTISRRNGYGMRNLKQTTANGETTMGGFNDWVQIVLQKPGVTVECGTAYGQSTVNGIYKKNRDTWSDVARLFWVQ